MKSTKPQYDVVFTTALATIGLRFAGDDLVGIDYLDKKQNRPPANKNVSQVKRKIIDYLDPKTSAKIIDVNLQLQVTPFQESVLRQLQSIPYGETRTYGEIAKILKTSPRAVGNACRKNPLPIVIPCHRVVAAKGIGGYSGATSGETLDIKFHLLQLEGIRY